MANISAYMAKAYLDYCLGGTTASSPLGRYVGLCSAAPTSVLGNEIPAASYSGTVRQTALFGPAASPAGSASNTAVIPFTFQSNATCIGLVLMDSVSVGAGTMLWYGTLQTARTPTPGDNLLIQAGALTITLS